MGAKFPNLDHITAPYAGSGLVINIDDLILYNTNTAIPAGSMADQGSEAANQVAAAPIFLGVAKERKVASDVAGTIDVLPLWIGDFPCSSATFEVGDMVTFCDNQGANALLSTQVKKTTNPQLAIGRVLLHYGSATTTVRVALFSRVLPFAPTLQNGLAGVGSGYKIARGQATSVTASDTVVTGLSTVVAAIANLESAPVIGCDRATASIGDQSGSPAAGSVLIQSWKPTSSSDTTPIAATTFSKKVNWVAIGT
jgi:hypothetical protein